MVTGSVLEMLSRNKTYAQTHQAPPRLMDVIDRLRSSEGVVVLSCCDPRVDPDHILGLDQTLKATHVRNAGGRALDAIRSIVVLQAITAPSTIVVMHHTDCGLTNFSNNDIKSALLKIAASSDSTKIQATEFGGIPHGDVEGSVREDVKFLKEHKWIQGGTQVVGLVWDMESGVLKEV